MSAEISTESTPARKGVSVSVDHLTKSFDGQTVVDDVSFHVEPGEIFVMMGASGSGKSTILKHIIGLETPDGGVIKIDGESIESPEARAKYRMAMVFQSGALLNSLNVEENVGIYLLEHRLKPRKEIERIVREKLEVVGLEGSEKKNVSELSGGMRKRVAFARALVIEPHLILYDEPTSELDPLTAATIGKAIADLNQRIQATSIVVTHDRDLAFGIADRVAVLSKGRILETSSPDTLKNSDNPEIREFLDVDFGGRRPNATASSSAASSQPSAL